MEEHDFEKILFVMFFLLCVSGVTSAEINGEGEIYFTINGESQPFSFIDSDGSFGRISDYDPLSGAWNYDRAVAYLGENAIWNDSYVNGNFDSSNGHSEFEYKVVAPSSDHTDISHVDVDFGSTLSYSGTISDFSFSYSFQGRTDSLDNTMRLAIQTGLSYWDSTTNQMVRPYSDYYGAPYGENYISEMNTGLNLNLSGTKSLDLSSYGNQEWWIQTDFVSSGLDYSGEAPTPPDTQEIIQGISTQNIMTSPPESLTEIINFDEEVEEFSYEGFDIGVNKNLDIVATIKVNLIPDSSINELRLNALKIDWETSVEEIWSNQYEISDGTNEYSLMVDLVWEESSGIGIWDVNVHDLAGRANSRTLYADSSGDVVAHEAGHWLGQFDEYLVSRYNSSQDPDDWNFAWWPLYDTPDDTEITWDFAALYDLVSGENWIDILDAIRTDDDPSDDKILLENWEQLINFNRTSFPYASMVDETGIMACREGSVPLKRNYLHILDSIKGETGISELFLQQAPTFREGVPGGERFFEDPIYTNGDINKPVPEPATIMLFGIGLIGLAGISRGKNRVTKI